MLHNLLYSTVTNKCPKCHEGNVFVYNNPYNLKHFSEMHENCPVCNEKFEKEPGYFYGAMYVSYAVMVLWFVLLWGINTFLTKLDTSYFVIALALTVVVLMPITFRTSRLLWLNMWIKFDKDFRIKQKKEVTLP